MSSMSVTFFERVPLHHFLSFYPFPNLYHNVFHILKLLWMKKRSELLSGSDAISILVCIFKAPLISSEHGSVTHLIINIIKLFT